MTQANLPVPKLHRVYHASLCCLAVSLPLFEAPKTLFLLLSFAFAAVGLWQGRSNQPSVNGGGAAWSPLRRASKDDWLLLAWMVSGFVVAAFAGLHYKEWGGANGPLQLALLLFFLRRSAFSGRELRQVLWAVLLATLLATLLGFWQLSAGIHKTLELKSVGHVNHSAIYLCLDFAVALALALTLRRQTPLAAKLGILGCLLLAGVAVVASNSRTTVMAMGAVVVLAAGVSWRRSKLPVLVLSVGLLAVASGLYFGNARVVQKHQQQTAHGNFLGERGPIWHSAWLTWRHNPWFGVGIKNYGEIGVAEQTRWLAEEGKRYEPGQYLPYAHAHSLYFGLLAEQGLFGFVLTLAVLLRLAWLLYRHCPGAADDDLYWALWLSASGALLVVLLNGVFNTTLHHEHGLLSVLLLGLWWSRCGDAQKLA